MSTTEVAGLTAQATALTAVARATAPKARTPSAAVGLNPVEAWRRLSTEGASTAGTAVTTASGAARMSRQATSPRPKSRERPVPAGTTMRRIPAVAA